MPPDSASDPLDFGDLLRQHRDAAGLTQAELAERAGLSVRGISDLERGVRRHPHRETVRRLCEVLGLDGAEQTALLQATRRAAMPDEHHRQRHHPVASVWQPRTPLPGFAGPLFGRAGEIAAIRSFITAEHARLVTLTGPGGTGKTRLAIAVATALDDHFPDGAIFVDLSPVTLPAAVLPGIAAVLGVMDSGSESLADSIARHLREKRVLIVLDNCEQVLEAAPAIAELLAACPYLVTLATSREPLRLGVEQVYPVSPLALPARADGPLSELEAVPAVALFVERAQASDPAFALTEENAAAVAGICAALDGLPLAIELAAVRIPLLPPAALLDRLERRLPLLTSGRRDAPARQQTLRDTIAWSDHLLDAPEDRLFHRLSIFAGGFTLEAVEWVSGVETGGGSESSRRRQDGKPGREPNTLSPDTPTPSPTVVLASLVDKSLVRRMDGEAGSPRYTMLETIREYAAERLAEDEDEVVHARGAQVAYLLQLARASDLLRRDPTFESRLKLLAREEANLRTALAWAVEHEAAAALQLITALGPFWFHLGHLEEGLQTIARVLASGVETDGDERARALSQAAWLAVNLGEFARAEELATEAHALAEQLRATRTAAYARFVQGNVAQSRGDLGRATWLLEDSLAQFDALDDVWGAFACSSALGVVALDRGDASVAARLYERALALAETHQGNDRDRAAVLTNLALTYRFLGQPGAALHRVETALALAPAAGPTSSRAGALEIRARLALDDGDLPTAAELMAESLQIWHELGDKWSLATVLEAAAALVTAAEQPEAAAHLLGAAAALRDAIAAPISGCAAAERAHLLESLKATLGEEAFTRAWDDGRLQPVDEAVKGALEATRAARGGC
jgi:predicted ATPase/transcriptional regulator with XRE-family HTH domain